MFADIKILELDIRLKALDVVASDTMITNEEHLDTWLGC